MSVLKREGMEYREDLNQALKVLKEGGVILYPTDTIWGLGCDATNEEAVEKIFTIKRRKEDKSLIVLVNGLTMLERYVIQIPDTAFEIIEVADKPITLVYPGGRNLAPWVCAEDGSVGIRIVDDGFCNELITRFKKPVVSTSANVSNSPSPANFSEIDDRIISSADYTVKFRQDDFSSYPPSSIIRLGKDGTIKIIRE